MQPDGYENLCEISRRTATVMRLPGTAFTMSNVIATSVRRHLIRTYNLCVVGFGNVGKAFVALLQRKHRNSTTATELHAA